MSGSFERKNNDGRFKVLFIALASGLFFFSCDNCGNLRLLPYECLGPYNEDFLFLKVQDSVSGADLLFGPHAKYDYRELKLTGIHDTLKFNELYSSYSFGLSLAIKGDSVHSMPEPADTLVIINFQRYGNSGRYKLWFNDSESDSLKIFWRSYDDDCCRSVFELSHVVLNDGHGSDLKGSKLFLIRK